MSRFDSRIGDGEPGNEMTAPFPGSRKRCGTQPKSTHERLATRLGANAKFGRLAEHVCEFVLELPRHIQIAALCVGDFVEEGPCKGRERFQLRPEDDDAA